MEDEKTQELEQEKTLTLKSLEKQMKIEIRKLQKDIKNLKSALRR